MALGNEIVLTPEPRGRRFEGIIVGTPKPGIVVQVQAGSLEDAGGRKSWEPYNKATSGVPALIVILDINHGEGKTKDDAYVSGTRGFFYVPLPGDELNMLVADQSGTGATSDFSVGDYLQVEDVTGKLIDGSLATSTNLAAPFQCHENITDMVGDTHVHVLFTGV